MLQFMGGLVLRYSDRYALDIDSKSPKVIFNHLFQAESRHVVEYSLDANSENSGTCILGSGRGFLERVLFFGDQFGFLCENFSSEHLSSLSLKLLSLIMGLR